MSLLNWTGETLTATLMSSGQVAASAQAVVSTHSPSWLIRPVSSATGMNSAGEIMPRSGWCQRSSASQPVILLSREVDQRLVVHLEPAVGDRLAQIHLQRAARLHARVHLRFEEAIGSASGGLGAVHREIGILQQLIEIGAILRRQRNADAGVGRDLVTETFIGLADRLINARHQVGDVAGGSDRGLNDGEFVAAEPGDEIGLRRRSRAGARPRISAVHRRSGARAYR